MPRLPQRRRRRSIVPIINGIDPLEARTLLSNAPVIAWSMVPQIAPDPAHGNQPDLPNTSTYVNPPGGYGVVLDARGSSGIQSTTTFAWTITDAQGHQTSATGADPTVTLPQGTYNVQLTATNLDGTNGPQVATTTIQVKDVLIVSIGDSYASGEGNPVIPSATSPQWAYSPDPSMNAQNAEAHRSTISGPAQYALLLQQANPHEAVTFVSVAASGASIPSGVLGPMQSIGNPNVVLPAQIDELRQIIGNRHIDVLTVSVGGDDIGFSNLARGLIENTLTGRPSRAAIFRQFRRSLAHLPAHYTALNRAIRSLDPGRVLVTTYPDLTRNQQGRVAAFPGPNGSTLVNRRNARLVSRRIIPSLDRVITRMSRRHHWTVVRGTIGDFRTHGYPSAASWFRTLDQSLAMEGSIDGTLHPNAQGQRDYAAHLLATYMGTIVL